MGKIKNNQDFAYVLVRKGWRDDTEMFYRDEVSLDEIGNILTSGALSGMCDFRGFSPRLFSAVEMDYINQKYPKLKDGLGWCLYDGDIRTGIMFEHIPTGEICMAYEFDVIGYDDPSVIYTTVRKKEKAEKFSRELFMVPENSLRFLSTAECMARGLDLAGFDPCSLYTH